MRSAPRPPKVERGELLPVGDAAFSIRFSLAASNASSEVFPQKQTIANLPKKRDELRIRGGAASSPDIHKNLLVNRNIWWDHVKKSNLNKEESDQTRSRILFPLSHCSFCLRFSIRSRLVVYRLPHVLFNAMFGRQSVYNGTSRTTGNVFASEEFLDRF